MKCWGADPSSAIKINGVKSHIAELNGLCDWGQAHRADSIWTLAYVGGTIKTEEIMAAGNQGGDHLVIHTVDAYLLSSHC